MADVDVEKQPETVQSVRSASLPAEASGVGSAPVQARSAPHVASPPPAMTVVIISRDYSHGEQCQFSTVLPPPLVDKVSSDTFESVIRDVNEILREAEDLGSANTLESVLGFATCFVSYAFITTHYEKCLVRVRARISRANDELFRPSGLYMKDPSLNGMLHIELIIL